VAAKKKRSSGPDPTIAFAREFLKRLREDRPPEVTLIPDPHADTAIERFVFSLNPTGFQRQRSIEGEWRPAEEVVFNGLRWGTANRWMATGNPQVPFKVQEITINAPAPGVCYVELIQAGRTNAQLGSLADAATFRAGKAVSLPWLSAAGEMRVQGTWTTYIPSSYCCEQPYLLAIDVTGWAKVDGR